MQESCQLQEKPVERGSQRPAACYVAGMADDVMSPEHDAVHDAAPPIPQGGLEVVSIAKSYDKRAVLTDISLSVGKGEVLGLLGPNGAGKTTCFYSIMGLVRPDAGRILMDGDSQTAIENLDRVPPGTPEKNEADQLIARLRLGQGAGADEAELRFLLESEPDDLETRFKLAQALAAKENYGAALEELLAVLKKDKGFHDDGARKAMLQIFEVLGSDSELTDRYRSELAKVLFS